MFRTKSLEKFDSDGCCWLCEDLSSCLVRLTGREGAAACAGVTLLRPCSYVVSIGLIHKLCGCFLSVQGPVDENPRLASLLQHAAGLLQGACALCWALTGR